jgi:hypothetical protein
MLSSFCVTDDPVQSGVVLLRFMLNSWTTTAVVLKVPDTSEPLKSFTNSTEILHKILNSRMRKAQNI